MTKHPPIRKWTFYRELKLDEVIRKTDIFISNWSHITKEPLPRQEISAGFSIGTCCAGLTVKKVRKFSYTTINLRYFRLRKQYQKTYGTTTNKTN